MTSKRDTICLLIAMLTIIIMANPREHFDFSKYKAGDKKSDGGVLTPNQGDVYLYDERIEVTIDNYNRANVTAYYTLKNEGAAREIHLQLPFMEMPENLNIESDGRQIIFTEAPYEHAIKGLPGHLSRNARQDIRRKVVLFGEPTEKKLSMQSALFSLSMKENENVTFTATYLRAIYFKNTDPTLERQLPKEIEKKFKGQRKTPLEYLQRHYCYNYTYLFQTGLSWPKSIKKAELIIKVKNDLIKRVITEDDLENYGYFSLEMISNSDDSLLLFNEDGNRQTQLLTDGIINGNYRVFYFEKENWKPTQNAGVIFLGFESQDEKAAEKTDDK